MKKFLVVLTMLALLLQAGALVLVGAAGNNTYHSSLVTHWDFEGEGNTAYADKAAGGATSDTLTAHGSDIVLEKGVAYIPNTPGTYLSASGATGTDLADVVDKTVVVKVALVNAKDGRGGVAGVFGKKWSWLLSIEGSQDTEDNAVGAYGFSGTYGKSTVMKEFRLLVITFDKTSDTDAKITYYISNKEVPESAADFTQLNVAEGAYAASLTDSKDFFLGRRHNHLDADRKLLTYFDDVKIYSSVLTLDEIAADAPAATQYQLDIDEGIQVPEVNTNYEKLKNLSIYAIGDSYFAGHGGVGLNNAWPSLLATKYEMTKTVDAISGSTLANWSGYDSDKKPMVLRYKDSLPTSKVDIVLIEGGRNDRGAIPIGENSDTSNTTFKGALNVMISDIKAKHPNALIICVTPWNALDKTNPTTVEYAVAMKELCDSRNDVKCIYAADPEVSGVDINQTEFRQNYCIGPDDHSHLNRNGMKLVLPYFEESIARLYYEHIGETFVDQTPGQYYKETSSDNNGQGSSSTTAITTTAATTAAATTAQVTDAATTVSVTTVAATTVEEKKEGCGSTVAIPMVVASLMVSSCCLLKRKKK